VVVGLSKFYDIHLQGLQGKIETRCL